MIWILFEEFFKKIQMLSVGCNPVTAFLRNLTLLKNHLKKAIVSVKERLGLEGFKVTIPSICKETQVSNANFIS